MGKVKTSIIIRSQNEEKWIGACLKSVFKQDYKNIEVILVDNESTDQTLRRARQFPIKDFSISDFFPGKALNLGIKESSGEFIVCISAHCIPVNDKWLSNLLANFDDDSVAAQQVVLSGEHKGLLTVTRGFGDSLPRGLPVTFRRDVLKQIRPGAAVRILGTGLAAEMRELMRRSS